MPMDGYMDNNRLMGNRLMGGAFPIFLGPYSHWNDLSILWSAKYLGANGQFMGDGHIHGGSMDDGLIDDGPMVGRLMDDNLLNGIFLIFLGSYLC